MSGPINQITPSLWVVQSKFYFTNSGIFLDDGQVCLIDPGVFPQEIKAIRSFVDEQKGELFSIVLTHCHWDHILGPEFFPGVKIISQAAYTDNFNDRRKTRIAHQVAEWEEQENIKREKDFVIPVPDQIFDKNLSLKVGNLSLDLIHAPGHTAEQMVIYQVESRVLWAADMLSDIDIPYVSDNLAAYERTLEMISTLDIEGLIPGHGHITLDKAEIRTRIMEEKKYLAELRGRVERAIQEGKMLKETVDSCLSIRFHFQDENERPHKMNVESVYLELGGETDTPNVGWDQFVDETQI